MGSSVRRAERPSRPFAVCVADGRSISQFVGDDSSVGASDPNPPSSFSLDGARRPTASVRADWRASTRANVGKFRRDLRRVDFCSRPAPPWRFSKNSYNSVDVCFRTRFFENFVSFKIFLFFRKKRIFLAKNGDVGLLDAEDEKRVFRRLASDALRVASKLPKRSRLTLLIEVDR